VTIRQTLQEAKAEAVSIGAVYLTLDRLERKGLVKSWLGEATVERGGRPKRFYEVQNAGLAALRETEGARRKLIAGSEPDWNASR
jgi:DNA-binding PadR family transcriptional regulator